MDGYELEAPLRPLNTAIPINGMQTVTGCRLPVLHFRKSCSLLSARRPPFRNRHPEVLRLCANCEGSPGNGMQNIKTEEPANEWSHRKFYNVLYSFRCWLNNFPIGILSGNFAIAKLPKVTTSHFHTEPGSCSSGKGPFGEELHYHIKVKPIECIKICFRVSDVTFMSCGLL